MNIKITYNWLLEYLETDATPQEIGKYLSLSGPSIERIDQIDDDYVFDIEITTNRIDMASVFGIAQEAQAILPQFGKKAKLKFNPLEKYTFENLKAEPVPHRKLHVEISSRDLVPRFTAMVFANVDIKPSPELIQKRLQMIDIKSINNVIDISNYLMVSLGQPTHMFDYDQIAGEVMKVRESIKGEKLMTLDGKELILPGGDIVIEDGSGRLIDLCGIMGGQNSSITNDTKNILFFVQTYNKRKIRKTSMSTGQRTMAATYFEKGLDPERVESTFVYGVNLINEMTGGIAHSELIDIYQNKREQGKVTVSMQEIHRLMGVDIEESKAVDILHRLGFEVKHHDTELHVTVPTFRTEDVKIKQDVIEEIARVYGYHSLPNTISPMVHITQPKDIEKLYTIQRKIKYFLKHLGLNEVMNYSMISGELLDNLGINRTGLLKLANTISTEIEYMRPTLLPSLVKNMKENMGRRETLKFFEIAKKYEQQKGELPLEKYELALAVNSDFYDLKGIIEALFETLNIPSPLFSKSDYDGYAPKAQATLTDKNTKEYIGTIGRLHSTYKANMDMKEDTYYAHINLQYLLDNYRVVDAYRPPVQFAMIKLDANVSQKSHLSYAQLEYDAHQQSKLLRRIEYVDSYKNNITLRFYFASEDRNITEEEAKEELNLILKNIQ